MDDSVRDFYDQLAGSYHLIFADWRASQERQAATLDRLIRAELGDGPHSILDCACGIGTQAIGLARLGHHVHATDLSPAAAARTGQEAATAGVSLTVGVADMRDLAHAIPGTFDVVLACDNALPHLMTDDDLRLAAASMANMLRPGGLFLASTRDYDQLLQTRPPGEPPRVFESPEGRRITFQVWEWTPDGLSYRVHLFLLRQAGSRWDTDHFETEYRALRRAELADALRSARLQHVRWHEPDDRGYYQPVVTARAADASVPGSG